MSPPDARIPTSNTLDSIPAYLLAPVRRWRITLGIFAIAVLAAAAVSAKYGQQLWTVEGTIISTPLPLGGMSQMDYSPPSPQTSISFLKSPRRLEQIAHDLELPVSGRVLERALKVNQQANVDAVRLTLDWPDPETGKVIVERVCDSYIREAASFRRAKIQDTLTLLQAESASLTRQSEEARVAYDSLPDRVNRPRLNAEVQRNSGVAAGLIADANLAREQLAAATQQIARTREFARTVEAGKPIDEDTAYRERKQALLDAMRAQQEKLQELDAEAETKKKDLAHLTLLLERGVGSKQEHTRAAGDVELLMVRRRNAANSLEQQGKELADLPRRHIRLTLAKLEEERGHLELKVAALRSAIDENQQEMVRLGELLATEDNAAKRIERLEGEHRAVVSRMSALERLRDTTVTEFAAERPTASSSPTSSNRKVLALLTFGGLMSAGLLGLVGHAWLRMPRARRVNTCGLPVLAGAGTDAEGSGNSGRTAAEVRRLALQLREPIRETGGLVLFAAADHTVGTDDVICQVARYLALAGEEVLILDARVHRPSAGDSSEQNGACRTPFLPSGDRGLSHCLQLQIPDETTFIVQTDLRGVEYLPAGDTFPDPDLLAAATMQRLLVRLADQYDRVLLVAPPLNQSIGAEILANYADGAVVLFRCGGEAPAECHRAVASIRAAGVPWVGAVIRAEQQGEEEEELPFALEILPADSGRDAGAVLTTVKQLPQEEPSVLSIAGAQATGVSSDTPRPLQATSLNPAWGTPDATSQHIKGRADLKAYRRPKRS